MIEQQREWLALLEAELARRTARQEWADGEDERQKEWVLDTLASMAQRLGAAASSPHPLIVDDMSPAEKLACHLLAPPLRPAGLPPEAAIWTEVEALREKYGGKSAGRRWLRHHT